MFWVRNGAVSKCILMRINRTTNFTIPLSYRYDVGTLGNESVFVKPLKKKKKKKKKVTQESY